MWRVLHGVYVDSAVPDDLQLRARALVKVVPEGRVIGLRTAGWLLTADVLPIGAHRAVPPIDLMAPSGAAGPRRAHCRGRTGPLAAHDVVRLRGVDVTVPARCVDAGFPCPEPQVEVFDAFGRLLARLDMGYRNQRKGLEFDGDEFHRTVEQLRHDQQR